MSSPPPFTAPWPARAFLSSSSGKPPGEDGEEKGGERQLSSSEAPGGLHTAEAAYWDNAVVRSYLLDEEYSDFRGPLFMVIFAGALFLAITGLLWGWMYRKIIVDGLAFKFLPAPQARQWMALRQCAQAADSSTPRTQSTPCMVAPNDSCKDSTREVYFWNITNPHEVLQGAPPALQEVGPFVFQSSTFNYNIRYLQPDALGPDRVEWATLSFADFVPGDSCAACQDLNATVYGPNVLFASTMESVGWDDARLLLEFVPATLSGLLSQMAGAVTQFVAQQPSLTALFPKLGSDPPDLLALEQWANCGALNGMPVQSLGISSLDALMPSPPEFCGWALSYMGASRADASLPTPTAAHLVALLNSNPAFVVEMTQAQPQVLAPLLNVTVSQARLLVGYVEYLSLTYAKGALLALLGPQLGPNSSGPIVGRTVSQWAYGWRDPVLQAVAAKPQPHWWSFDPLLQFMFRPSGEQPRWAALAADVAAGIAPVGAAQRFQTWVMATGRDGDTSLFRAGNLLADNGQVAVTHPGGTLPVTGRAISQLGFGNMGKMPFGLDLHLPAQLYQGAAQLGGDPQLRVGLGRVLPLTWDGRPPGPYMSIPAAVLTLSSDATTPCGAVSRQAPSLAALTASEAACVTGDYIAGVWNLSKPGGTPLYISQPHFLDGDPRLAASLGPGAGAMQPVRSRHGFQLVVETILGIPLAGQASFQTVIAMRPTRVLSPSLFHGAPGPGGYTYLPASWTAVRFKLDSHTALLLYMAHYVMVSNPRVLAGTVNLFASLVAGFAAYSLVQNKRRIEHRHQGRSSCGGADPKAPDEPPSRAGSDAQGSVDVERDLRRA